MRRPYVCFFGDEDKCRNIMNRFNAVEAVYITRNADISKAVKKRPALMFAIAQKGQNMHSDYYMNALTLSFKHKTPVFTVCSADQFFTFKNTSEGAIVYRTSLTGISSALREMIKFFEQHRNAEFMLIKSVFTPVTVISDNAILSAYAENKICPVKGTNNRLVIVSPDSDPDNCFTINNNSRSFIITANKDGSVPISFRRIYTRTKNKNHSCIYLTATKDSIRPEKYAVIHTDIFDENDTIERELRKKRKSGMTQVRLMTDKKEKE